MFGITKQINYYNFVYSQHKQKSSTEIETSFYLSALCVCARVSKYLPHVVTRSYSYRSRDVLSTETGGMSIGTFEHSRIHKLNIEIYMLSENVYKNTHNERYNSDPHFPSHTYTTSMFILFSVLLVRQIKMNICTHPCSTSAKKWNDIICMDNISLMWMKCSFFCLLLLCFIQNHLISCVFFCLCCSV